MAKKNYVYKKPTDAALNPWLMSQTDPSSPVPEEYFADSVMANNSKQNNDEATQQYLDSLAKANQVEGVKAPPPAQVPPTPPMQDVKVPSPEPTPEALLAAMPALEKGSAPLAVNTKGEQVAPDKPGVALSFPAADVLSTPQPGRKMLPYSKSQQTASDTQTNSHTGKKDTHLSQAKAAELLKIFQGHNLSPMVGPDGKPMVDANGDSVYDPSKETVDPSNPYQQSLQGIQAQQQGLDNLLKYSPVQRDLSPLMALAAAWSKTPQVMQGYKAPRDFTDTYEKVLAGRKGIVDQQNKLVSDSTAGVKALKDGSTTDLASQILMNKAMEEQGVKPDTYKDRLDLMDSRLANQNHRYTISALDKDKAGAAMLGTYRTLGNAMSLIDHPGAVTVQQVDEFQSLIRGTIQRGVGGSGTSGQAEREAAVAHTFGWNLDKLHQFVSGTPAEIMKDDKLLAHLKEVAGTEQQNLRRQYHAQLDSLSSGFNYMYDREDPNFDESKYGRYADALDHKLKSMGALIDPIGPTPSSRGAHAEIQKYITDPGHQGGIAQRKAMAAQEAAANNKSAPKDIHKMTLEELKAEAGE